MAQFTRVDQNQTGATTDTGTGVNCALSTAASVGDVIVVVARMGSTTTSSTITDNLGNTYLKVPGSEILVGSFERSVIAYARVTTAGTPTVNVLAGGGGTTRIGVGRYTGFRGLPQIDQFNHAEQSGSVASATSGSITTAYANELLIGYYAGNTGTSTATASGSVSNFETVNTSKLIMADAVVSATGTYTASWTISPNESANTEAMIASFYDSASGMLPLPGPGVSPVAQVQFFPITRALSYTAASPNVTAALTGQTITSTIGAITPQVSYGITGLTITSSEGTLTASTAVQSLGFVPQPGPGINPFSNTQFTPVPLSTAILSGNVTITLSGQAITTAVGSLAATVSYGITGQSITSTQGTISPEIDLALTGQGATSTVGTPTPAITYSVSGQTLTSAEGSIAPEIDIAVAGQSITSSEGLITASQTGDITLQLTGLSAVIALGQLVVTGADQPPPPPAGGSAPGHVRKKKPKDGPYMREGQVFGEEYPVSPFLSSQKTEPPRKSKANRRALLESMMRELL